MNKMSTLTDESRLDMQHLASNEAACLAMKTDIEAKVKQVFGFVNNEEFYK